MLDKIKLFYDQLVEKGIRLPLIADPKTKAPSISFTLLVISATTALTAIGLNIAKVTDNTSSAIEFMWACSALYFGRSLTFKGQEFKADEKKEGE